MTYKTRRLKWYFHGLPNLALASALCRICTHTMTTPERAASLWHLCKKIIQQGITGDFVECGVWKGGSSGLMGLALKHAQDKSQRTLHLFDSFEGLPEPGESDGEKAADYWQDNPGTVSFSAKRCIAEIDVVRDLLLNRLNLDPTRVQLHKGWFDETVPVTAPRIEKIALLRLDGDWYESTMVCLEHLYDRVVPGGIIILDDYHCWEGCKKATDEFRQKRNITEEIVTIDCDAAYWIKGNR